MCKRYEIRIIPSYQIYLQDWVCLNSKFSTSLLATLLVEFGYTEMEANNPTVISDDLPTIRNILPRRHAISSHVRQDERHQKQKMPMIQLLNPILNNNILISWVVNKKKLTWTITSWSELILALKEMYPVEFLVTSHQVTREVHLFSSKSFICTWPTTLPQCSPGGSGARCAR